MNVQFRPRAVRDLIEIGEYLRGHSPRGAASVERAIRRAIRLVGLFPEIGRPVTERPGVRVIPVRRYPYLIFYEIAGTQVIILHVRHGTREPVDPSRL